MKRFAIPIIAAVILVPAAAAGVYATMQSDAPASMPNSIEPAASEETAVALSDSEIEMALEERILGSKDAPLTITEHSSLTCGHCGKFHKETFKKLKEAYIDTGKVKLVFSDFPLNGPALKASAVARCVDQARYFDFVQLLFETQDQWAFSDNYKDFLKQNAQMTGLAPEKFEACFNSEKLQEGLLESVKAVQEKHQINSTPSFVLNGEDVLSGALSFESFSKKLDEALAK